MKSPAGSPVRQPAFESPSHDYSDDHFKKSFEAETKTQRSFDEPAWGTFDNNDDTDSVWGFSSMNVKDSDHGEKYFFESSDFGGSPVRTFEDPPRQIVCSRRRVHLPLRILFPTLHFLELVTPHQGTVEDQGISSLIICQGLILSLHKTMTSLLGGMFDSINSTSGFDHSRGFSWDDSDPFGLIRE